MYRLARIRPVSPVARPGTAGNRLAVDSVTRDLVVPATRPASDWGLSARQACQADYCTTRLKLTDSVIVVSDGDWKVPVTVRGYVPGAVPGGSTPPPPPPPPHDGNVARAASVHNKKIEPHRRRAGLTRRLPGRTTRAAKPAIPASPTSPAIRSPFARPNGKRKPFVARIVVAVTWALSVVDPSSVIEAGDTVQVARAGAPLQLSDTNWLNPLTGARSTV